MQYKTSHIVGHSKTRTLDNKPCCKGHSLQFKIFPLYTVSPHLSAPQISSSLTSRSSFYWGKSTTTLLYTILLFPHLSSSLTLSAISSRTDVCGQVRSDYTQLEVTRYFLAIVSIHLGPPKRTISLQRTKRLSQSVLYSEIPLYSIL